MWIQENRLPFRPMLCFYKVKLNSTEYEQNTRKRSNVWNPLMFVCFKPLFYILKAHLRSLHCWIPCTWNLRSSASQIQVSCTENKQLPNDIRYNWQNFPQVIKVFCQCKRTGYHHVQCQKRKVYFSACHNTSVAFFLRLRKKRLNI